MALIEVEHLSKSYGSHLVLDDISFAFEGGQIIGLLGPNGSGKTSLIKILVGLIKDYTGGAYIDGHPADPYTKAMVAYLPEKTYLPDWMRCLDAIEFFAASTPISIGTRRTPCWRLFLCRPSRRSNPCPKVCRKNCNYY